MSNVGALAERRLAYDGESAATDPTAERPQETRLRPAAFAR